MGVLRLIRATRTYRGSAALLAVGLAAAVTVGAAVASEPEMTSPSSATPEPYSEGDGVEEGAPVVYAGELSDDFSALTPEAADKTVVEGIDSELISAIETKQSEGGEAHSVAVSLSENNESVREVWTAGLAVGALAEKLRSVGDREVSDVIDSATATGPSAAGTELTMSLGVGAVALGQVFGSPSDAEISARVERTASEFRLKVAATELLHPVETALSVEFVVPDGSEVEWTIADLQASLLGETPMVEGLLVTLVSPDGDMLMQSGAAYRTGEGGLWFAPGQDVRFGAVHGGTPAD